MKCICNDGAHSAVTALWHRAYCRWYDHGDAGNHVRAALYGWIADRLARWA